MQIKIFKNLKEFTLTSTIKKADIDLLSKYKPAALKKTDSEGNVVFAVSYVEGKPSAFAKGVTFGAADVDTGCAMIIGRVPAELPVGTTVNDYVADYVGGALSSILEFETSIPETAAKIKAERDALIASITEA